MTAFKEILIGGYVLRFWPSDNGWMCGITPQMMDALEANEFNPDWDTQAVLVEEIQRMAKRIEELEAKDESFMASYEHKQYGYYKDESGFLKLGDIPQRTWVGLTDEEWLSLGCKSVEEVRIGLAIQAKLKEKNT